MVSGYMAWAGGVEEAKGGRIRLQIGAHHLNFGHSIHGGLSLALVNLAHRRAAWAALTSRPGVRPALVSSRFDLVGGARQGDWVEAEGELVRATRSLLFVRSTLRGERDVVVIGTAIFKLVEGEDLRRADEVAESVSAMLPPVDFALYDSGETFTRHAGPMYERYDSHGERHGAFRVERRHLADDGSELADEAAVLLMGDLMLGRRAWDAVDHQPCVTLSLDVSCIAEIRLGDVVELWARCDAVQSPIVFVAGEFTVSGRTVMSATGRWKILGAA